MDKDKFSHMVVRCLIGFVASIGTPAFGVPCALLAGWTKERMDKRDPLHHTYDPCDMYATAMGGGIGVTLYILLTWFPIGI